MTTIHSGYTVRLRTGKLLTVMIREKQLPEHRGISFLMSAYVSANDGLTWRGPQAVFDEADPRSYWMMGDRITETKTGRILLPAAMQPPETVEGTNSFAGCFYSDDGGDSWKASNWITTEVPEDTRGFQEPAVVELEDGSLRMIVRTGAGVLYQASSSDGGITWGKGTATQLMSACAPANVKRDPYTGHCVLVWNRSRPVEPNSLHPRCPLSVAISKDQARSWAHVMDLESVPTDTADPKIIQYTYPAIAFTEEAMVVSYNVWGKAISYTKTVIVSRNELGMA